jgi:flagellar basal-body rod protein FlgC
VETSNTDIGREMVDMITTSRAFEANTTFIRADEEMTGHLLNMIA